MSPKDHRDCLSPCFVLILFSSIFYLFICFSSILLVTYSLFLFMFACWLLPFILAVVLTRNNKLFSNFNKNYFYSKFIFRKNNSKFYNKSRAWLMVLCLWTGELNAIDPRNHEVVFPHSSPGLICLRVQVWSLTASEEFGAIQNHQTRVSNTQHEPHENVPENRNSVRNGINRLCTHKCQILV